MDAKKALESSHGVLPSAGWKPAKVGNFPSMERADQPVDQPAMLRAWEQRLAALIARITQGDQTALAALYDETNTLVYSLASHILRDRYAAEDVTIEVYTRVFRQASHYNASRGTPSAWLLTLTRGRAIERLRTETQRREGQEALDETTPVASLIGDPGECGVSMGLRTIVRGALAALTPEQREVIEIAYYSGLSHQEIAAKLGQPVGSVNKHIRTGMMLLREHLHPFLAEA